MIQKHIRSLFWASLGISLLATGLFFHQKSSVWISQWLRREFAGLGQSFETEIEGPSYLSKMGAGVHANSILLRNSDVGTLELKGLSFTFHPWDGLLGRTWWKLYLKDIRYTSDFWTKAIGLLSVRSSVLSSSRLEIENWQGEEFLFRGEISTAVNDRVEMGGEVAAPGWKAILPLPMIEEGVSLNAPFQFRINFSPKLNQEFSWNGDIRFEKDRSRVQWDTEWSPHWVKVSRFDWENPEYRFSLSGDLIRDEKRMEWRFSGERIPAGVFFKNLARFAPRKFDEVGNTNSRVLPVGGWVRVAGRVVGPVDQLRISCEGSLSQWIFENEKDGKKVEISAHWKWEDGEFIERKILASDSEGMNEWEVVSSRECNSQPWIWCFRFQDTAGKWMVNNDRIIQQSMAAPQRRK
jgi:hypothetical protein